MRSFIAGWDIGGAHVKLALLSDSGDIIYMAQRACPLWKGVEYLQRTLAELAIAADCSDCRHAVTMTGELVDCFQSREEGVFAIVQAVCTQFTASKVMIFAGLRGFLPAQAIQASDCMDIASANWLASVLLVAKRLPNALFVDIGSTTCDLLLIENAQLQVQGLTDYQRLVSGELLYTGVVRTAVMAIAQQAEFNGHVQGLMAEYFATMADVYRVTGDLREAHDQSETADGAEKTLLASARRLSRMTGYEFAECDLALWQQFAVYLKSCQKTLVSQACQRQMQRSAAAENAVWVGAGVGRFLVTEIAEATGMVYQDFADLLNSKLSAAVDIDVGDAAPAAAVAYLAGEFG